MKFNDHIRDYKMGAERFDMAAATVQLQGLIGVMLACRYRRGFMTAARAVRKYARHIYRASQQAERYRWKLNMLRTQAWRETVLENLGGLKALARWVHQPSPEKSFRPTRPALTAEDIAHRARVKLCAKACAHPGILRDPCRVDQEGLFRLPPKRRHIRERRQSHPNIIEAAHYYEYSYDARPVYQLTPFAKPIMVWPDEFLAFAEMDTHWAALQPKAVEDAKAEQKRIARTPSDYDPLRCDLALPIAVPRDAFEQAKVYAPP